MAPAASPIFSSLSLPSLPFYSTSLKYTPLCSQRQHQHHRHRQQTCYSLKRKKRPISTSTLLSLPFHSSPSFSRLPTPTPRLSFNLVASSASASASAVEESSSAAAVSAVAVVQDQEIQKRKLYVVNMPWSITSADLEKLFAECGTVQDVELIKQNNGKNRGFGFVTMASDDEARAVVDKFASFELEGRTIKVEFAKSLNKPSPPPATPPRETSHKLFISNLQWKVRSSHLREFFSANNFSPSSARVVFDTPGGRAAGYGFASFATEEEANAAISALDGKELMGRPLRLRISQNNKNADGSENKKEKAEISVEQPENS